MALEYFIARTARNLVEHHGADAIAQARSHLAECRARDEAFAADAWMRIVGAVEALLVENARAS